MYTQELRMAGGFAVLAPENSGGQALTALEEIRGVVFPPHLAARRCDKQKFVDDFGEQCRLSGK